MLSAVRISLPSFWRLQASGWILTYGLLLLAAMPHLAERDVLRYNTVGCTVLFCASLAVWPFCQLASVRWTHSWLTLEACALALSLLLGVFASFLTGLGTFGWTRLNGGNSMLSALQSDVVIFLWCNLYISIAQERSPAAPTLAASQQRNVPEYATQFAIRTGPRIQVIYEENVLWISAARDYTELHTPSGAFLLRETMQSLQQRLDPNRFVRIHRSRIVRWDQIVELNAQDSREYAVKLRDGSVHRSSRTYASALDDWLRDGLARDS